VQFSRRGILGGIALATMGVASFRLGDSLGPNRSLGKNLYAPRTEIAAANPNGNLRLTGLSSGPSRSSRSTVRQASDNGDIQDVVTDGPGETFEEVYQLLKRNFVDWKEGVNDDTQLAHGAASAMLASLGDPKSRFVDANQMKELQGEIDGTYHGIGAVTDVKTLVHGNPKSKTDPGYTEYRLTVVAPLIGSPAEKAGLQPGDVITEIDGKWIATYDPVAAATKQLKAVQDDPVAFNKLATQIQKQVETAMSLSDGEDKLTQTSAEPLVLTVEREGAPKPLKVTLDVSAPTTVTPIVAKSLPNGVGYIHINQIVPGSEKDFQTALDNFGNDLKGLVLDLRNTPGGQLAAAKEIAQKISNGKVFGIDEKKGKQSSVIALKSTKQINCPVVVLINGGTASTAELLASVLHDSGSKLVGQTTFGDAMNVVPVVLRDGAGFTMTVGKFYTASHTSFADGIKPDIVVPNTASPDELLNQAIGTLSGRVAVIPTPRG
jgi:carboxyl-terminal processing protease